MLQLFPTSEFQLGGGDCELNNNGLQLDLIIMEGEKTMIVSQ